MRIKDSDSGLTRRLKTLYHYFLSMVDRAKMTEHSFVLLMAVIIGLLGGYGAVLIQFTIKEFQHLFWRGDFNLETINNIAWYWVILIPVFGGLVVGLIIQYYSKEAKGHGVPEVMEAIALKNGIIRARVVVAKLFSSALYIAAGGSVGREGPVIQIGSAVGSSVGQFFRVNQKRMRTFVACGAASGIAAAFNAPVAGALFAVEIILGDFAVPQFSPIVISSVTATVVSRHFLGDFPAFIVPKYNLFSPLELINYVVLGVLAGLTAVAFIKTLYFAEDFFESLPLPQYVQGAIGGLLIGIIGMKFPHIFGVGYDSMDVALAGHLVGWMALALVFVKILATSISLGSGGSGGIFAPSLFMGSMLGVFFGGVVHYFFPQWTAGPGAYALVAMGGVVGATTHGPITAILIIFELTNDYKIILPLMITTIISTLISIRLQKESIYTLKLVRRGINIFAGREVNVLRSLHVADVPKRSINLVEEQTPFNEVLEAIVETPHNYTYVMNKDKRIVGYISMNEIRQTITEYENLKHLLIAEDIAQPNVEVVHETDDLDHVMKQFARTGLDEMPVISGDKEQRIVGSIWQRDVIAAYNQQIFLRDMSGETAASIHHLSEDKTVHVVDRYHFYEVDVPPPLVGKSLAEIDLRNRYNLELLLIKRTHHHDGQMKIRYVHPHAKTHLKTNDVLLLFGFKEDFQRLKRLKPLKESNT